MEIKSLGHEVTLTDEEFYDICDVAGYGIRYWCDVAEVVKRGEHSVLADMVSPVPLYIVQEEDSARHFFLYKSTVEVAYGALLDGSVQVNPEIIGWLRSGDIGEIDALAADVLIQVAAFGEIVYG